MFSNYDDWRNGIVTKVIEITVGHEAGLFNTGAERAYLLSSDVFAFLDTIRGYYHEAKDTARVKALDILENNAIGTMPDTGAFSQWWETKGQDSWADWKSDNYVSEDVTF